MAEKSARQGRGGGRWTRTSRVGEFLPWVRRWSRRGKRCRSGSSGVRRALNTAASAGVSPAWRRILRGWPDVPVTAPTGAQGTYASAIPRRSTGPMFALYDGVTVLAQRAPGNDCTSSAATEMDGPSGMVLESSRLYGASGDFTEAMRALRSLFPPPHSPLCRSTSLEIEAARAGNAPADVVQVAGRRLFVCASGSNRSSER
jgi:hypothetical protein